jgi:hypothetical protein
MKLKNAVANFVYCIVGYSVINDAILTPVIKVYFLLFLWRCYPTPVMASSFLRFIDHTKRRMTFGRTPLDE